MEEIDYLFYFCKSGDVWSFEKAYECFGNPNLVDEDGNSLLFHASSRGKYNIVVFLVEKGADVNQKNKYGYPPLSPAVYNAYFGVAMYLIENGACINFKTIFNRETYSIAEAFFDKNCSFYDSIDQKKEMFVELVLSRIDEFDDESKVKLRSVRLEKLFK